MQKFWYFSILGFLQDSLYLGQFLAYIGPLYHFGILKVHWLLSIQIGKRIIKLLERLWSKTWEQKLLNNPLFGRLYTYYMICVCMNERPFSIWPTCAFFMPVGEKFWSEDRSFASRDLDFDYFVLWDH